MLFPETHLLRLPDGRRLAYAEFGDPGGRPLFFFHGWPGSRLEAHLAHAAAVELGVRAIGVDRPGIGGSDPQPGRRLLDWPADVGALADALGLGPFAVLGFSGGGPYAVACAHALPPRLNACGILGGLGPREERPGAVK